MRIHEEHFTVDGVPAIRWTPDDTTTDPRPLILIGHGGGQRRLLGLSLGCGLGVPCVAAEPRIRAAVLGLFDAFGSAEKTLHANPGRHGDRLPEHELDSAVRSFTRHLTPRADHRSPPAPGPATGRGGRPDQPPRRACLPTAARNTAANRSGASNQGW
ncbi:hypothetical protein [Micromonospora haikouensis]|uniref:hypothetical protein n=1 Tax=Micromonospora haikouensis TaxID=686309 RepID=UPI003D7652FB